MTEYTSNLNMRISHLISIICVFFLLPVDHFAQQPEWQWVERGGGSASWNPPSSGPDDEVTAIELDKYGNVYVCGRIFASGVANFSGEPAHVRGYMDGFVAKYDCEGNLKWHITAGGKSIDELNDLALDSSGNIYITGMLYPGALSTDSAYIGDNAFGFNSSRAFVAKLDTTGKLVWVHIAYENEGPGQRSYGTSLDIDKEQNLYVTGFTFVDSGNFAPSHSLEWGNYIAKYSTSGKLFWVKQIAAYPNPLVVQEMAVSSIGNLYIVGSIKDTLVIDGMQFDPMSAYAESIVLEYDTLGNLLWGDISQSQLFSNGYRIEVDMFTKSQDIFYIVGNTTDGATFGSLSLPSLNSGSFGFVVKYKNQIPIWIRHIQAQYTNSISAIALDNTGNIYLSSEIIGNNLTIGGMKVKGKGGDPFVAKFKSNGDTVYARNMSTNASGFPTALAAGYNGNFYLGGSFSQNIRLPRDTVWNVGGNTDMFIAKFGIEECEDTTTVDTTIGIVENSIGNENYNFKIYPNPSSGHFYLQKNSELENGELRIYNSLGEVIHKQNLSPQKVEKVNLPASIIKGIYFVEIRQDYAKFDKKLIIE